MLKRSIFKIKQKLCWVDILKTFPRYIHYSHNSSFHKNYFFFFLSEWQTENEIWPNIQKLAEECDMNKLLIRIYSNLFMTEVNERSIEEKLEAPFSLKCFRKRLLKVFREKLFDTVSVLQMAINKSESSSSKTQVTRLVKIFSKQCLYCVW